MSPIQTSPFILKLDGPEATLQLVGGKGAGPGFARSPVDDHEELDQRIYKAATEAARRRFSPEFMNRIDKVIVFRALKRDHLEQILDIELERVQQRIMRATGDGHQFLFCCTHKCPL